MQEYRPTPDDVERTLHEARTVMAQGDPDMLVYRLARHLLAVDATLRGAMDTAEGYPSVTLSSHELRTLLGVKR